MGSNNHDNSKEFLELIKSTCESRSKAEEDRIVLHGIEALKRRINEIVSDTKTKQKARDRHDSWISKSNT
ncbi:hypothetical protein AAZX31_13G053700 [Glycine max]